MQGLIIKFFSIAINLNGCLTGQSLSEVYLYCNHIKNIQVSLFLFQVRSAFFEVITTFCQRIPESMNEEASRVCPAVLLSIDDSDAIVCLALWEAVLHVLTTIEVIWKP